MTPFARTVLDECTAMLVESGLQRKRRGLVIFDVAPEMTGAVAVSSRGLGTAAGDIEILPYAQVFWRPVEELYALGEGRKYRFTELPTMTQPVSVQLPEERPFYFQPDWPIEEETSRFALHVQRFVVPRVKELAHPECVIARFREGIAYGGGFPERYLAMRAWQVRSVALDAEFDWVMSQLSDAEFQDRLATFYQVLKRCEIVAAILAV